MGEGDAAEADGVLEKIVPQAVLVGQFVAAMDRYALQMEALKELLDVVVPHVAQLDTPEKALDLFQGTLDIVPNDKLREVQELFEPGDLKSAMLSMVDRYFSEPWGPPLIGALLDGIRRPRRVPILMSSLLTSAVSGFEVHLAELTKHYYRVAPSALEAVSREKEKEFSLADLMGLGAIEDAVDLAISRRVEELLFGSFPNWRKFYKDRMKIDFAALAIDWDSLAEVFSRRHTIVHNGGKATRRYVNENPSSDVEIGSTLHCDEEYIRNAIDELLVLGVLLALETYCKFGGNSSVAAEELHKLEYNLMVDGRWRGAGKLSAYGVALPVDASTMQIFQVNLWLSAKNLGGLASVKDAIENWDVSALSEKFQLARACLLDDFDEAFRLLPGQVATGEISGTALVEWPLFARLRKDPRFESMRESVRESVADKVAHLAAMTADGNVYHKIDCPRRGRGSVERPEEECIAAGARAAGCCHRELPRRLDLK